MNLRYFVILTVFTGTINTAEAIVDESSDPDMVVSDKLDRDWKAQDTKILMQKEKNRMETARLRADKIRNLAPDAIPLWVASNKSNGALNKYAQASSAPEIKVNQILIVNRNKSEKSKRWSLFLFVLIAVFICGFFQYRNTRQPRT